MIKKIICGDVTESPSDIIIGMNSELGDLSALGRQILQNTLPQSELIDLGTVLSFHYEGTRFIHMLICHHLGGGGWNGADQFVRVALDHLWVTQGHREFGIVQIGTGRVGKRDGADRAKILAAIASSYLHVDLYVRTEEESPAKSESSPSGTLQFTSGWSPTHGRLEIQTAA